ncbi:hypothetical protein SADUNF_Sadunf19G0118900 [Salix dunnii]|uniref:Cytochrome b-c1 complex subunit 8 n=1 Tax=Salix dunnii TaxID=1413687 RepID=A0A835J1S3_9ROSI|nr:hypothetical protein SADUNF_Sadunf19G0118900 [Salix dunnii]
MGKQPVKLKAVVYALSPFQQKVMPGLWKDLPGKIHHKVSENWISATLLLSPLVGVYTYVQNYQEKEKLEHRTPQICSLLALYCNVVLRKERLLRRWQQLLATNHHKYAIITLHLRVDFLSHLSPDGTGTYLAVGNGLRLNSLRCVAAQEFRERSSPQNLELAMNPSTIADPCNE